MFSARVSSSGSSQTAHVCAQNQMSSFQDRAYMLARGRVYFEAGANYWRLASPLGLKHEEERGDGCRLQAHAAIAAVRDAAAAQAAAVARLTRSGRHLADNMAAVGEVGDSLRGVSRGGK